MQRNLARRPRVNQTFSCSNEYEAAELLRLGALVKIVLAC